MAVRLLLLFTVIVWGWSFVATKICLSYVTPVELIGLRFLIALPILGTVIGIKRIPLRFTGNWKGVALGSGILMIHFLIQVTGINYTTATNTGWIIAATPLVMALLAAVLLKERLRYQAWIGIGVATFGILLLVSRGRLSSLDWLSSGGDWLVLGSAHTWALYTIATRNVSRSFHPLAVTFAVLLPISVLTLTIMILSSDWSRFISLPFEAVAALLFLGIAATALAHWFWQEGISRVGAAEAGLYLYLEPVATTVLAVSYLGESYRISTGVGGLLVLGAVWYAQRRPRQILS